DYNKVKFGGKTYTVKDNTGFATITGEPTDWYVHKAEFNNDGDIITLEVKQQATPTDVAVVDRNDFGTTTDADGHTVRTFFHGGRTYYVHANATLLDDNGAAISWSKVRAASSLKFRTIDNTRTIYWIEATP